MLGVACMVCVMCEQAVPAVPTPVQEAVAVSPAVMSVTSSMTAETMVMSSDVTTVSKSTNPLIPRANSPG